jgi:restriction system protein
VAVLILLAIGGALLKAAIVLVPLLALGAAGLIAWKVSASWKRRAELAEAERIRTIRSYEIAPYHQMSATEFEHALAFLCRRDGCPEARVTGRAGDLGADVIAITPDRRRLVIQAKRYVTGNLVTGPDLQKFAGTCFTIHRAHIAALVTTSSFTKQGREMAARAGILLFDADGLGGWVSRTGPPPWALVPALPQS